MNYDDTPKLAFPFNSNQQSQVSDAGMTLRDYFAAQVIPALLDNNSVGYAAQYAYQIADEMMKARAL